jgi:hypothetical protein
MRNKGPQFAPFVGLLVAILLGWANAALADHGCCAHCGCSATCQKVCRLVCDEKKVETTCWGCKIEDFCVPGPSKPECRHCKEVCESCDTSGKEVGVRALPKNLVWTEWIPGCARLYTKKKLMKKTVTTKVPSYKWVVEDLCEQCEANCVAATVPPGVEIPPPPAIAAKLLYGMPQQPVFNVAYP